MARATPPLGKQGSTACTLLLRAFGTSFRAQAPLGRKKKEREKVGSLLAHENFGQERRISRASGRDKATRRDVRRATLLGEGPQSLRRLYLHIAFTARHCTGSKEKKTTAQIRRNTSRANRKRAANHRSRVLHNRPAGTFLANALVLHLSFL